MRDSYFSDDLDWISEPNTVILKQAEWFKPYQTVSGYLNRVHEVDTQIENICKDKWSRLGVTYYFRDPQDAMMVRLSVK